MNKVRIIFILCLLASLVAIGNIKDPVIPICVSMGDQSYSEVAYNCIDNEYLVVWEDYRNIPGTQSDIWGQIIKENGEPKGNEFSVCSDSGSQWWPHVDFDPVSQRYLVVFEDNRRAATEGWFDNYDVYGALLDVNGKHIPTAASEADTCFGISLDSAATHYPDVAWNYQTGAFMVVWADNRNSTPDIYGQIVDSDGNYLYPADPAVNFPVCDDAAHVQDVPVVVYNNITNEWLAVFAQGDWSTCDIRAQRIGHDGILVKKDGAPGADAFVIKENIGVAADPSQPRAHFNNEYLRKGNPAVPTTGLNECLIVWKDNANQNIDLFAQRLAFFPKLPLLPVMNGARTDSTVSYYAMAVNLNGDVEDLAVFPVSAAPDFQNAPDIAYSALDNEYLVAWPDSRNWTVTGSDFYCQRLHITADSAMVFLGADRQTTTDSLRNIPVDTTIHYEGGSLVGAAHNSYRNEYLMVYTFKNDADSTMGNIYGRLLTGSIPVKVQEQSTSTPLCFSLAQNYPNPFNPATQIAYTLDKPGLVSLEVYTITGAKIKTLVNATQIVGTHTITWNGSTDFGVSAASGVYIYKMTVNDQSLTRKMLLVR
ncbi:MAG TPA: T9SS type A sorting domain-containing protein [bacterium]|nr:T9SS type A sorting domain-containing protein [bacterium]HPN43766.1 T9SS type A sorting domain-containing protein [bacterium]